MSREESFTRLASLEERIEERDKTIGLLEARIKQLEEDQKILGETMLHMAKAMQHLMEKKQ